MILYNDKYYDEKRINEFIFIEDEIKKPDIILIPGSSQEALAIKAAEIFKKYNVKYIVVSGYFNEKIQQTEARFLSEILIQLGVPSEKILLEETASNTLENAEKSFELLCKKNIAYENVVLVCKNYHAKRAKLTYEKIFKNHPISVVPVIDDRNVYKDSWFNDEITTKLVISELHKIKNYHKATIE